jgi:hypothetical protein
MAWRKPSEPLSVIALAGLANALMATTAAVATASANVFMEFSC